MISYYTTYCNGMKSYYMNLEICKSHPISRGRIGNRHHDIGLGTAAFLSLFALPVPEWNFCK